ncbi:staphylokinase domain-containing protein [Streptococcus castoreus]|uniref:staphylokinase domain-containing protein n=1 Tax=Streptococcus castoreus TaxID=254786 RepID=UPI0004183CF6|nr:staphylokinase domain-containing protein [Streptococcus castoreus]
MKKRFAFGIITVLFAFILGTAHAVYAIAGPDWLLDQPSPTHSKLVINVDGIIEGSNKPLYIKFLELGLNSPHLEKKKLLAAIQDKLLSETRLGSNHYEVVDFAPDAKIRDRFGKVYFADQANTVTVPLHPIQEYVLDGHVIVRPYKEKEIKEHAKDVAINYTVNFLPLNLDDDFKPITKNSTEWKATVGETITSEELLHQAQEILKTTYPDYVIKARENSVVTHNNSPIKTALPIDQESFTYRVKAREQAYTINQKSGVKELAPNTDLISETYYILKKGTEPYRYVDQSKKIPLIINYVDAQDNHLLKDDFLMVADEQSIDFGDGYDDREKHKVLFNNLDMFDLPNYTLTGKVESDYIGNYRVITVYMSKRPEGENASYHLAYDKDRYTEEEREAYHYLRDLKTTEPAISHEKNQQNLFKVAN